MEQQDNPEGKIVQWAEDALHRMRLSFDDLEGKSVLDVGSGENKLAQAAKIVGSSANIYSIDIDRGDNWIELPSNIKRRTAQASAEELPFPDNTFDLIVNIASVDASSIRDEGRVLKPDGEIRINQIGGQVLDMWYVAYYLQVYQNMPRDVVYKKLVEFEESIEAHDGWRPNEYAELEKTSIETLSTDEKLDVIESLVARFEEVSGVPLQCIITDSTCPEPTGYIIGHKPSNA